MTAIGAIDLERSHGYCKDCHQPQYAADRLLGIDGWLTPRARAMADRAGIHDPFRPAEVLLEDLAGWSVDAETIRRCCHQDAKAARQGRSERQALPEQFAHARAEGEDQELQIDAGKVNTPDGWRDVKVAVFACRERGEPATSEDYEQRELPEPSARSVVAEVEEAQEFGRRCQGEAVRLGVLSKVEGVLVLVAGLSVLGDGAEWIWNLAGQIFVGATQALDVYHGCEKLAGAGRAALGEEGLKAWLDGARVKLVGDGYAGVCEVIAGLTADAQACGRLGATGAEVLNYFCGHQDRLGYAARLLRGQAIGSGLVEGTIKQRVNVRMKRSGARWLAKHVGPFVELMAMSDSPEWSEFWALTAA
jgi:hypothetical protein